MRSASLLVALAVITLPISIWPGKSVAFLYQQLPVLVASVVIVYKLSYSWRAIRGTFMALAVAGTILMATALLGYAGGRAQVDSMYDTNDLAYVLVTVFPIAVAFTISVEVDSASTLRGLQSLLVWSSRSSSHHREVDSSVYWRQLLVIVLTSARHRTTVGGVPKKGQSRVIVSILACVSLAAANLVVSPRQTPSSDSQQCSASAVTTTWTRLTTRADWRYGRAAHDGTGATSDRLRCGHLYAWWICDLAER